MLKLDKIIKKKRVIQMNNEESFLQLLKLTVPDIEFYTEEEAAEFESTEREISASRTDITYEMDQNNAARNRSFRKTKFKFTK